MKEARSFVYAAGQAIQRYAHDHDGCAPDSLSQLYPLYTRDRRVTTSVVRFSNELAALDYSKPGRLGDPHTLVMEVRWLHKRRGLRPVELWGDLHRPRIM